MKKKVKAILTGLILISSLLLSAYGGDIIVQFHDPETLRGAASPSGERAREELVELITGLSPLGSEQFLPDPIIDSINRRRQTGDAFSPEEKESFKAYLQGLQVFRFATEDVLLLDHIASLLTASPFVEYATRDNRIKGNLLPNDTDFGLLWGMEAVKTREAWDVTTGSGDVIVAVIDTGVNYNHPELFHSVLEGYDFVNDDYDPMDDNAPYYHGTHIAGIIAAAANDGYGICGLNWNVKILPVKTLDANLTGKVSQAVKGIDYAIARGADIINLSMGLYKNNALLYNAIKRARDAGILVITSAGNGGEDFLGDNNDEIPFYPSSFDLENIISVANVKEGDILALSSNWGVDSVDLAAPGSGIYSTSGDSGYSYGTGTSMAAPFVAGAAALLKGMDPGLDWRQIKQAILENVDPASNLEGALVSGGRLNLFKTLTSIAPVPLMGDVNRDGRVNALDALITARYYVGYEYNGFYSPAGDTNQDGAINTLDALIIARNYADQMRP